MRGDDSGKAPWPTELLLLGNAATPKIYADVLDCAVLSSTSGSTELARPSNGEEPPFGIDEEASLYGAIAQIYAGDAEASPALPPALHSDSWQRTEKDSDMHDIYLALWEESVRLYASLQQRQERDRAAASRS